MIAFRHSAAEDVDAMDKIVTDAVYLLGRQGIDQWQKGYPNRDLLVSDIEHGIGYVLTDEDKVVALCAVTFTEEPSYLHISNGNWLTKANASYATIHRMAVDSSLRGKGYAFHLFSAIEKLAVQKGMESIRIDTHEQNHSMQRALKKSGFIPCGNIILCGGPENGDPRIAYEKLCKLKNM